MNEDTQTELERLKTELFEACRVGDQPSVDALVEQIAALTDEPEEEATPEKPLDWNTDPKWMKYCEKLETAVKKIAAKYTTDDALREDCQQEARIALYTLNPERTSLHKRLLAGEIDQKTYDAQLDKYCRNLIRNSVLSYLDSIKTGSWYIGRTRRVRNRRTGQRVKTHVGARYSSLDELVEDSGLQVDTSGDVTWDVVAAAPMFSGDPGDSPWIQNRSI